eukprot:1138818-Pelagomonas_calceolata.AAC.11
MYTFGPECKGKMKNENKSGTENKHGNARKGDNRAPEILIILEKGRVHVLGYAQESKRKSSKESVLRASRGVTSRHPSGDASLVPSCYWDTSRASGGDSTPVVNASLVLSCYWGAWEESCVL